MIRSLLKCYKQFLNRQFYHARVLKEHRYKPYHILVSRLLWKHRTDPGHNRHASFLLWTASKMRICTHKRKNILSSALITIVFLFFLLFINSWKTSSKNKGSIHPSLLIQKCILRTIPVYLQTPACAWKEFKVQTQLYVNQKHSHLCESVCVCVASHC